MNNVKEKYQKLCEEIYQHNYNYYVLNSPTITDEQYDHLYEQLLKIETKYPELITSDSPTQKVGHTVVSKLSKTIHEVPLLSLDKTKSIQGLKEFIDNRKCIISLKLDGLTTELIYENGKLIEASTRGDGYQGEVITHNVKTFKNIPLRISFRNQLKLSGESIILISDFNKINEQLPEEEKFANPRNLVAGSCRQLNNRICAERNVYFYAFNLLKIEGKKFKTKQEQLVWLEQQGFEVVPYNLTNAEFVEYDINELKNVANNYSIPIDGIVVTYNDIEYSKSLGSTAKFNKDSIAYKFEDERVKTVYKYTKWNTTRTGRINPTGVFEPVIIDGTEVEKASLFNLDIFENLQLGKGDKISVYKANMIIPQVDENFTKSNTEIIPSQCPVCGAQTEIKVQKTARFLYCTNENCRAKLIDKLIHFVSRKCLNIEGLSEQTIQKFIKLGYIKNYIDIFRLEQYKNQIVTMAGFGQKSYNNLINSIEKAKDVELYKLIFGLGINQVGEVAAKNLCKYFNNDVDKIISATYNELLQVEDFGEVTANSVYNYFNDSSNKVMIKELLNYIKIKKEDKIMNNQISGKVFVITGTLSKPREEFVKIIESMGAKVTGSVSKKTDYLLAGQNVGATKLNKAKECGTIIITEGEFNQIIGG